MKRECIDFGAILDTKQLEVLSDMAGRISQGAVFIYPTETIYGIGGRYDSESVYKKILSVKGRSPDQPMILIGATIDCFSGMHLDFPDAAIRCANKFWPGLLTMVLPSSIRPEGVAIRVSNHPFITAISRFISIPLFSTSANQTAVPYNPDPDIIYGNLGQKVDFMVDAGILPPSLPSTVVKISADNRVTVVREGCIPAEKIFEAIN